MLETLSVMEKPYLDFVQTLHCPVLDAMMRVVTVAGKDGFFWMAWALILICFSKDKRTGVLMLVSLFAAGFIGPYWLKSIIARPRPCAMFPLETMLVACSKSFSFPSGHATLCFAAAGVLFFRHAKFAVSALVLSVIVAFSRNYLYVHFATDVLVGALLGMTVAYIVVRIAPVVEKRVLKKAES